MTERKKAPKATRRPAPSPSNAAIAKALCKTYPVVFDSYINAKQIVDAVLGEMSEVLIQKGALVLRGIATIRVTGVESRKEKTRRRLVVRTSWLMLSKLNPTYPKVRNRKPKSAKAVVNG